MKKYLLLGIIFCLLLVGCGDNRAKETIENTIVKENETKLDIEPNLEEFERESSIVKDISIESTQIIDETIIEDTMTEEDTIIEEDTINISEEFKNDSYENITIFK